MIIEIKTPARMLLGGFFIAGLILCTPSVFAVEYGGVGGRPAYPQPGNSRTESIFVHTIAAGEAVADGVLVSNNTAEEKIVLVHAVDSARSSDGAFACAQDAEHATGVGTWISLEKIEVVLAPYSKEIVPFTISVPALADVGESNGCITIQEKIAAAQQRAGVNISFRAAMRVAVTVPGNIIRALTLESVQHVTVNGTPYLDIVVRNTGNVSIDASVRTDVRSFMGQTILNQEGKYPVLRGEATYLHIELPRSFWGSAYRSTVDVMYDTHPEASIGVTSGMELTTLRKVTAWSIVVPVKQGFVFEMLILACVAFCVIIFLIRRIQHKRLLRTWTTYTVHEGDTLYSLAKTRGVAWKKIARVNRLKAPYVLEAASSLRLPEIEMQNTIDESVKNRDNAQSKEKENTHVRQPQQKTAERKNKKT